MSTAELMTIQAVSTRLGVSVHQLRRWELMFGLEIKRGRGQQRQYRQEDLLALERIRELIEDGWPAISIRSQLELEELITPRLIGLPSPVAEGQGEFLELLSGLRNFCEHRFQDISDQVDELRQLVVSLSLQQGLQSVQSSPWRPIISEAPAPPAEEISIGPAAITSAKTGNLKPQEVSDQNFLMMLGKALDVAGWSDAKADEYSLKNFKVQLWIDLSRAQAEQFIDYLKSL